MKTPKRDVSGFTTLNVFLDAEGTRDIFQAVAIKEVLAWQIGEAMKAQKLTRKALSQMSNDAIKLMGRFDE